MSGWKKLAAASAAGGEALNVEDVFSTYVYDGNSSNRSITNGIDLSTEGGMVWIKGRTSTTYDFNNTLFDTERGAGYRISTDLSDQQRYNNNSLTSFNTDGFSLGTDGSLLVNWSSNDYVSWTFRKAPKFFDVVTYTGTGSTPQTISHNLGSVPGCIIIKRTDGNVLWRAYHRGLNGGVNPEQYSIQFNESTGETGGYWNNTAPTSTEFTVTGSQQVGGSGMEYVAYLFAHNDDDGEFGPNGDADIIKCGYYTGTGAAGNSVDLGFEPQWLMIRRTNGVGSNAYLYDTMRGMFINTTGSGSVQELQANSANKERDNREGPIPLSNGFRLDTTSSSVNGTNDEYIYIAIRRGPMAVPESATDVFDVTVYSGNSTADRLINTGFPVDLVTVANRSNSSASGARSTVWSRFVGPSKHLTTSSTSGEIDEAGSVEELYFDQNNGYRLGASTFQGLLNFSGYGSYVAWSWRRAPSFFDVVAYTGAYSPSGKTINHNLGVAPEMIWVKSRNATGNWYVYHANVSADPETDYLVLNEDDSLGDNIFWNDTAPTDTQFFVNGANNANGDIYVAYLFASLDGISKVGSYTGNGSSQTIDCGFSSGARFVLIKRTDISRDWYLWDSARGIVSGNDPHLSLNTTATEVTTDDSIDPSSSGFIVNQVGTLPGINVSSGSYVFYAIA